MIHGRQLGEEFGLAIAEFSLLNKPVFTSPPLHTASGGLYGQWGKGAFHLMALGETAFRYTSARQLEAMLERFDRSLAARQGSYWNTWRPFAPEHVMRTFDCVHLRGGTCQRKTLPGEADDDLRQQPSREALLADPCAYCSDFASAYYARYDNKAKRAYLEDHSKHFH